MTAARITVRERIDPRITSSLFSNYRSAADAVMELIDNAVDSRLPKRPLVVRLAVHPASLSVMTVGGEGMGVRELERNYLRWGGSPKRGRHLLGQYGQGGKAAIGHLGRRFAVEASRPRDEVAWRFTDDDYRDRSHLKTYDVLEVPRRVPAGTGYVRVRIDAVDTRIDVRRLGQKLGETYRPLVEAGDLILELNSAAVRPAPLAVAEREPFSVNAAGGRLRGWIGVADPDRTTPGWIPGLRCYKLGRLVVEGEFFGHPGPAHAPAMARLMGEVDVPQAALTMNKSDFDRDADAWLEVEARMHRLLAPLARRLQREDEAPPPASAVKVAEQVRRLLGQALRLAEREDMFAGLGAAGSPRTRRPPAEAELPLEAVGHADEAEPEPAPPPLEPPRAPARRGFGNIVIRSLDPSVRSTTLIEEGVRVVVINARYPLFQERHGDVWYQLETAAREICRAAEGSSVAEYERRVNEILLTAFQLRARRRRPRGRSGQMRLLSGS
ncbi:MAG: ATP-binding protein [Candidatus Dormibacterales bacterium]